MKVELPEGAWADIRDPRKLNELQTAELEDVQFDAVAHLPAGIDPEKAQDLPPVDMVRQLGREGAKAMREMKWTTILVYVSEWSFGAVSRDVLLQQIPSGTVTALFDEISKIVRATGGPRLNAEVNPDPASPTLPLNG
ncbi:hypothetical protein [Nocardia jiangxiensis]|uniref:hypothetical protein n=1 Tax=Nocardia jiangxiensis TaxID=282685 RepID=UPI000305DED6|nr:hypothetical protein [Nocardia jiangxiensis]